jgi:protein-L-isoaspartate(D-aspartate) O-methyltransferase
MQTSRQNHCRRNGLTPHRQTIRFLNLSLLIFGFLFPASLVSNANGQSAEDYEKQRAKMVELAVKGAGVTDERVLRVMLATPRHEFVPSRRKQHAYLDAAVPIGAGQTISSPFIVAYMTQMLDPQPEDKVLEIGTGSGYQAAILSPLVKEVYSIEIVESLGKQAAKVLKKLKYNNVLTKVGDGYLGWPEHAPFDKIIVTCSPEDIPQPLVDQLKEGGLIVVPIGERHQQTLYLIEKKEGQMVRKALVPTLFVPMTGAAEDKRQVKPDPANPVLINGDFEEVAEDERFIHGWYYERLAERIQDSDAPSGNYYLQFHTDVPGQLAHLMQSVALDGESVSSVKLTASVACENVARGPSQNDYPGLILTFYNDQREELGHSIIGPFNGTREWKDFVQIVRVPRTTTHAFIRIGLFGAVGTAKFDNISLIVDQRPAPKKPARPEQTDGADSTGEKESAPEAIKNRPTG